LKTNTTAIYGNANFIGYYGVGGGYVYDEKIRGSDVNKGGIAVGDTIQIKVNLSNKTVTWSKNGT